MRIPGLIAVLGMLAACGESIEPQATTAVSLRTPVSDRAGPGAKDANQAAVVRLFKSICIDTDARPGAAAQAIHAERFIQNSGTGTYYHRDLNLSISLQRAQCSIVAGGRALGQTDAIALKSADKKSRVKLRQTASVGGVTYISAFVPKA